MQGPVSSVRVGAEEVRSGLKIFGLRVGSAAVPRVTFIAVNENSVKGYSIYCLSSMLAVPVSLRSEQTCPVSSLPKQEVP